MDSTYFIMCLFPEYFELTRCFSKYVEFVHTATHFTLVLIIPVFALFGRGDHEPGPVSPLAILILVPFRRNYILGDKKIRDRCVLKRAEEPRLSKNCTMSCDPSHL